MSSQPIYSNKEISNSFIAFLEENEITDLFSKLVYDQFNISLDEYVEDHNKHYLPPALLFNCITEPTCLYTTKKWQSIKLAWLTKIETDFPSNPWMGECPISCLIGYLERIQSFYGDIDVCINGEAFNTNCLKVKEDKNGIYLNQNI